jgi:general stress protein 26
MTREQLLELATNIINANDMALVGTTSLKRYPNVRVLKKMKNEGLKTFYFCTRLDSEKVKQVKRRKKGCIYFYDRESYVGVMIEGKFRIERNTMFGIPEIYELDPHDPYEFCTMIFESKCISIYKNYKTVKIEL